MFGQVGETEFDLRFRVLGIPVRVHPLFWAMAAYIVWSPGRPQATILGILCVFVSILAHEMGHALVTRSYGFRSEIVLHWMGGYATSARVSTWKRVWLSLAGPLAGFLVWGLCWGSVFLLRDYQPEWLRNENLVAVLSIMIFINGYWSLMNLLPCLPLDGGRITEALVERYFPRRAQERTVQISILASGAVAVYAFQHMESMKSVMILFGLICLMNVNTLNQLQGRQL